MDKGRLTLRVSLSGTFLQRKDVVNQSLEFGVGYALKRFVQREEAIEGVWWGWFGG